MCFSGNVTLEVAKVRSLFPRLWASSWESCRQKVHRTVARARFVLQNFVCSEHLWKTRLAKFARDCSQSSILHFKSKKTAGVGALLENEVEKVH